MNERMPGHRITLAASRRRGPSKNRKPAPWWAITTVSSLPMTVPVSGSLPYNDFTSRFPHRVWLNRTSNNS